ncbi:Nramp family divalent metal transporter [Gryllotalpicola reticulitermitis]|uniref:Nramp family divalent metal transporter n=1 Tax=Gryllotalpicola reticulitermitis TaxID=1184153 RepID=A0ABV8Q674_9MICO
MAEGRVHRAVSLLGPAFVASVAYVDPGNFATNFEAGAQHGYLLVWVVVLANVIAILCQYLSAKLGIATGMSLPEVCRAEYRPAVNAVLWVQAEAVAIATDLAEFVGAALGLNLVFAIPLLPAGLITGAVSFAILLIEQKGYRPFEIAIVALLLCVAAGFIYDLIAVGHQSVTGILDGILPRIEGSRSETLAVGIIGATVMPHVIYLHSALHATRIRPGNDAEAQTLNRYSKWDCIGGLGGAGIINLVMLWIAAALFFRRNAGGASDLGSIYQHLGAVVGAGAALAFAISLAASGIASSTVGTYAGQVVMQGFMNWRIPLFWRRAITMLPSLAVLAVGVNTTSVLIVSQVLLSFGIPFALIPLLLHTRKRRLMGSLVNGRLITWAATGAVALIVILNVYLIWTTLS